MRIRLQGGLLYVPVQIAFRGRDLVLDDVVLDTGSAGSVVSADAVLPLSLVPEPLDRLRRIRGVGGVEFVFTKRLDRIAVGDLAASDFEVEVGALDYGFSVQGILGLDSLLQAKAVIDLGALELRRD
ncbi:MAG TPA: retropepsin-like aspartic protease [Thermoanaerobaculia bacterium]|nr:retropepsin-like aspartic protease [Thermoanaerobaculia bacterium]